jgi:hypothetical protein
LGTIARLFVFIVDWWLLVLLAIGIVGTIVSSYLAAQNEFLREWDPTIKVFCWIVATAIAYGLISKRNDSPPIPSIELPPLDPQVWVNPMSRLNLRICPGSSCSIVVTMEQSSRMVWLSDRQIYTEQSGSQTPWIKVRQVSGLACRPANTNTEGECLAWEPASEDVGWVNETLVWPDKP